MCDVRVVFEGVVCGVRCREAGGHRQGKGMGNRIYGLNPLGMN